MMRSFMRLREAMVPYIYTQAKTAYDTGGRGLVGVSGVVGVSQSGPAPPPRSQLDPRYVL